MARRRSRRSHSSWSSKENGPEAALASEMSASRAENAMMRELDRAGIRVCADAIEAWDSLR
jgi:hypothetical protein